MPESDVFLRQNFIERGTNRFNRVREPAVEDEMDFISPLALRESRDGLHQGQGILPTCTVRLRSL